MSWEDRIWCFVYNLGLNPEAFGELLQVWAILLFVVSILWFILPYLPDEPERGWGPKKKPRAKQ